LISEPASHGSRKRYAQGPLPTSLLQTCKQIHEDAAAITWSSNTFQVKFPTDGLETFVRRLTPAQRRAVRTIALDFVGGHVESGSNGRYVSTYEDILILRAAERASYLALTGLRRAELTIDMWAGVEAFEAIQLSGLLPYTDNRHIFFLWVCTVRLLQRDDIARIDVSVEADETDARQPGMLAMAPSRRQCEQWEEQVELIVRGKMDGLCGQLVYAIGASEDRKNPLVGSDFMFR
jgi:hypothetical protein